MFGIGWPEFLLIGVVALLAIGPRELPGALTTLGRSVRKLRQLASSFQSAMEETLREAELEEIVRKANEPYLGADRQIPAADETVDTDTDTDKKGRDL